MNKGIYNKRLNVNKVSTEGTELEDGTVAARVDLLGKIIPRQAIEDKLIKLVKTSINVDGKLVHALVDSGTKITVVKKDLVPGISVEGASTIYLKGIFGPAVKCPLVYVPILLATGGQVNVVHQQVLCALAEDVLLPPDLLDILGGARNEENSLAQSSQDLGNDSGSLDEIEVSSGILLEKAPENFEDSQSNITSCRNEVGTTITKGEEVTVEMDKGSMVADSFRSEQECCAELALAWEHAKEDKGNYYQVDGEHDKDPDTFFSVIYRLKDSGECFDLSVIGETFTENPKIFEEAKKYLEDHIVNWGYVPNKEEYYQVLRSADVVVSTAIHEFFGVSMLEATSLHCYPLCPNRLVYPEIYPEKYLYNTPNQLYKKLKYFCKYPNVARHHDIEVDLTPFTWTTLKSQYNNIFMEVMT
ncbi:glycosyltransferase-like domain-containing protein 1 [Nephila pilipes]|uniref:Glycosyltransferase-like domain-containing protein 1 n=1 Tax=Nephila pilipes TaxID=299642 RepID=A0A8X6I913_NEPPI|nr:glycosyltransferase-like domain-containing protein 1 [Nephila pilipes]